jgi:HPt (histidine-containing phosphotransfer) domain-containing protein
MNSITITPDEIPAINYERIELVRASISDPAVLDDLFSSFLESVPVDLKALETISWEMVQVLAHRLKSSSGNLGADRLRFLFSLLEHHPARDEESRRILEEAHQEFAIFRAVFGRSAN